MERDTDSAGVEFRVAVAGPLVTLRDRPRLLRSRHADLRQRQRPRLRAAGRCVERRGALRARLPRLRQRDAARLQPDSRRSRSTAGGSRARSPGRSPATAPAPTRFAARLGAASSMLMIGVGIFLFLRGDVIGGIWLGFIGFFLGQAARSAEFQTEITSRIEGLLVADVMDAEPVAVPATLPLDRAPDEYFLRYGYPWFPVVDEDGRLSGLVTRGAAEAVRRGGAAGPRRRLGHGRRSRAAARARFQVGVEEPLELAAGPRGAAAAGGDHGGRPREGRLRGIVTVDQVRRALQGGGQSAGARSPRAESPVPRLQGTIGRARRSPSGRRAKRETSPASSSPAVGRRREGPGPAPRRKGGAGVRIGSPRLPSHAPARRPRHRSRPRRPARRPSSRGGRRIGGASSPRSTPSGRTPTRRRAASTRRSTPRTHGSRTPTTRSRARTTWATRTRSRSCAARRPRRSSAWSTWG